MEALLDPALRPSAGGQLTAALPAVRIIVTGPECTGKTTLARELAEELGTLWVPEFARRYAAAAHGRPLTSADVEPIARGQIAQEDAVLAELRARADDTDRRPAPGQPAPGRPALVQDTDLVSTVVYARHYYGSCPPWILAATHERLGDLYLLADIDIAWEPDGIRDRPFARDAMLARFREHLDELGARTRLISGQGSVRLAAALAAVHEELPELRTRTPNER